MLFGLALKIATSVSPDTRRAIANKVAETAQSAYIAVKREAIRVYEEKKEDFRNDLASVGNTALNVAATAVDGANLVAEKALAAAERARQAAEATTAKAADSASRAAQSLDQLPPWARHIIGPGKVAVASDLAKAAASAFRAANTAFTKKPAADPVAPCPHDTSNTAIADTDRDGWIVSPQGDKGPCKLSPPGDGAVAKAQEDAKPSENSCCGQKHAKGEVPPRDIVFVNGIQNTAGELCETLKAIAGTTCARVIGVYNATSGKGLFGIVKDGLQTAKDRQLVSLASSGKPVRSKDGRNPAVDTLTKLIADGAEAGNPPELWSHSQGGAILALSLMQARNDLAIPPGKSHSLAGIKVKSFGSAAPIWPDGPDYEHDIHVDDPVATTVGLGHNGRNDGKAAGAGAQVTRFSGDPKSKSKYETISPNKAFIPYNFGKYHGMNDSYLKAVRERSNGCPWPP